MMQKYLMQSDIVDFRNEAVRECAAELARNLRSDTEIARNCFEFVRDEIRHSGDFKDNITTCRASEVLEYATGWCYAKSHLLAALLRANGIPAAFCYQRLKCFEYRKDAYCLHGLNAVYLKDFGWYRVDARGNKKGVDARFDPPNELLAFELEAGESDIAGIYSEPLKIIVDTLRRYGSYTEMIDHFPDLPDKTLLKQIYYRTD